MICCAFAAVANADDPKFDAAQLEFFEKKIRPVLVEHCYKCHGGDKKSIKGSLRLDTRAATLAGGDSGPAIVPSKPDESLVLSAMKYEDFEMPPSGKLPAKIIADFETWIRNGAADPRSGRSTPTKAGVDYAAGAKFWAFRKPVKSDPPQVSDNSWIHNDIDRFVLANLEANKLLPSDPAAKETLIRRAYLGVIGLPPSSKEVQEFVADESPKAFDKIIDRLLESKHYGERWGRHWLDVARYGEDQAHTFKARKYPRGYFYRDWVVDSFNNDMPFNEFVRNQVAGDLIDADNRHTRLAALGLFALGPVYYAENVEKAKAAADEWDDRIDTLTRGVLALTVSCARCHDHKYDPISMQDYYGLAGIFASTRYEERPIVSDDVLKQRKTADAKAQQQQVNIDRYLSTEARNIREKFVEDIPKYFVTAWKIENQSRKKGTNVKKLYSSTAKSTKLNQELLKRWVTYLRLKSDDATKRPYLTDWFALQKSLDSKTDLSADKKSIELVTSVANAFMAFAESKLDRKAALFEQFGADVAFVREEDKTEVQPGMIPLGNLFDDSATASLDAALSTDRFGATASDKSLGVYRVLHGWGARTNIAPDVSFDFAKLGADTNSYSNVTNDGWQPGQALSTSGKRVRTNKRLEQGIGMHANALITFDLDEIRRAGLMPANQKFRFKVDRAGINDDAIGSAGNAHVAVIVSRPHKDKTQTDAILAAYVNGEKRELATDDFTYYFAGDIPKPLRADGRYVSFDIAIPSDAKHVTLVTAAAEGVDGNSISSDHTVFSGARLELDPLPEASQVAKSIKNKQKTIDPQDRADAVFLSELFYDDGLLALPPKDAEPKLGEESKKQLAEMRKELAARQAEANKIEVLMAHSLNESGPKDLPVYLAGNPARHGDIAQRAMPAIFTSGQKQAFDSNGSGRLELAMALTSDDNPLTARVIVNRVWAGHFGFGLVRTPSNFGQLGERPTHPELLDYLAIWFMDNGWSLKKLHRLILQSATYQQSSAYNAANFESDPENRMLWRMNRRRLEIEPWRDAMLTVSGELDASFGGPSKNLSDANNKRRTLYGFISRHRLDELLRLFDFPDPNITAAQRTTTTVPLQQLFVLNSEFMIRRARALAQRLNQQNASTDDQRVELAYQLVYGRSPRPEELDLAVQFLQSSDETKVGNKINGLEQLALALLSSNEFMFVD